jgi:rhodanese-related sulfurtransferase/biotin operon repressor
MSTTVNPKREVFENLARIGTALSSAVRLDLLELLAQGERSVDELAALTGATVANASQHLQKLKQVGLIVGRKEAQFVKYRLAGDEVIALFNALGAAGQAYLADVDRIVRLYFTANDEMETVAAAELLQRAKKGLVTVLDVRPREEFAAGHVPGAINIPIRELEKRLAELPKRKEVVAYCRGPYCLMSYDAVHLLRKKGLKARRLQDGLPEWRLAGLPTARD